jgi:hypothetical protein
MNWNIVEFCANTSIILLIKICQGNVSAVVQYTETRTKSYQIAFQKSETKQRNNEKIKTLLNWQHLSQIQKNPP